MLNYIKKTIDTRTNEEKYVIGYSGSELPYSEGVLAQIETSIKKEDIKPSKMNKQLELIRLFREYLDARAKKEDASQNVFSEEYFKNTRPLEYLRCIDGIKPSNKFALDCHRRIIRLGYNSAVNFVGRLKDDRRFDRYEFGGLCKTGEPLPINKETIMFIHNSRLEALKRRVEDVERVLNEKSTELAEVWSKTPAMPTSSEFEDPNSALNALRGQLKGMGDYSKLDENHKTIHFSLTETITNLETSLGASEYNEKQALLEENPQFFYAYDEFLDFYRSLEIVQRELAEYEARYLLEPDMVELEIEWEIERYNKDLELEAKYRAEIEKMDERVEKEGYTITRKYRPAVIKNVA